jgi:transposase
VVGDNGSSRRQIRRYLRRRGFRVTIPRKQNARRRGPCDRAISRTRRWVERLINRRKQFRRVATRYEKHGENYAAMITLAAIMLWL